MSKRVIKSTDEHALEALRERLVTLETAHEEMKARNKYHLKHKTMIGYPGMNTERAIQVNAMADNHYNKLPYDSYQLQNSLQEIHRTRRRIKALEQEQTKETEVYETEGLGFEVVENKDIGRLQIIFPERTDPKTYKSLRHHGFVFSRTNQAFQRQLNENARWAAKAFIKEQREMEAEM